MAGKKDSVWIADTMITHLQSCLPAKLDTLDTEYADGITLDDVPNEYYYVSEKQKLEGFPLVCVISDEADARPDTGEARYGLEFHQMIIAIALVGNNSEEELTRRTSRTLRGIQECFEDNPTMNCSVDVVEIVSKQYLPLLADENGLLKEAQLTLRAKISD